LRQIAQNVFLLGNNHDAGEKFLSRKHVILPDFDAAYIARRHAARAQKPRQFNTSRCNPVQA